MSRAGRAPIMDDLLEWAMDSLDRFPAQGRASMAKDFTEGRSVELEGLNGALIRLARQTNTPTPANDYAVLKPAADRIAREHGGEGSANEHAYYARTVPILVPAPEVSENRLANLNSTFQVKGMTSQGWLKDDNVPTWYDIQTTVSGS